MNKIIGLRKFLFAIAVCLGITALLIFKVIDPGTFKDLLIWIGVSYFLANTGSKAVHTIQNNLTNKNNQEETNNE